ncbi:SDR family NAD(P)-dependent oxidoreductase [Spirosoma flavum]|uniref:SDR family NAD(P)-dependent oxidoreductase n=1 Tax=Spirosoma flavum TaxID=2048557 RepID=A0ABW6AL39_9BACT
MGIKTALITGANTGLGLATAKELAIRSFDLILLCRNLQKGQVAQADIQRANPAVQVDLVIADLGDIDSLHQATERIKATHSRLDVLINNAGYTPASLEFTKEGIEKSFYASHIGHFRLLYYLTDLLKKTAAQTGDVRVISLSSAAHILGRKSRFFRRIDNLSLFSAYGDDKLANLLLAKGAARQFAGTGIRAYSVHPGAVRTNFGADTPGFVGQLLKLAGPFMRTPQVGAQTTIFLASAPLKLIGEQNTGGYFADSRPKSTANRDITDINADWLWQKSLLYV